MNRIPGQRAAVTNSESNIFWGGDDSKIEILRKSVVIDAAARDAGNTPTTTLRKGLILGVITASGKVVQYDNAALDGTQTAKYILDQEIDLLEDGTAVDQFVQVVACAPVRVEALLIEGAAFVGNGDEAATRTDLKAQLFRLNDEY